MAVHEKLDSFIEELRYARESLERIPETQVKSDSETLRARERLHRTLISASDRIERERLRLVELDPTYSHTNEEMDKKLTDLISRFRKDITEEIKGADKVSKQKLDKWNFGVANATQDVVANLIENYQRQHQPIPISHRPSHAEERWHDCDGGSYQGHWENGRRHGHGSFKENNGDRYDGEWKDNKKHGLGVQTWASGNTYDGDWENDRQHGYGVFVKQSNGDLWKGMWDNSKLQGWGKYESGDKKTIYEGEWEGSKMQGWGKRELPDEQAIYEGEWYNDRRQGRGKQSDKNGEYDGEWVNDKWEGQGTFKSEKGVEYTGIWHGEGSLKGPVTVRWPKEGEHDGGGVYEGGWKNGGWKDGTPDGEGKYIWRNQDTFKGRFKGWSVATGEGEMILKNGKKIHGSFQGFPPQKKKTGIAALFSRGAEPLDLHVGKK